jgi:hypothetical protein
MQRIAKPLPGACHLGSVASAPKTPGASALLLFAKKLFLKSMLYFKNTI